MDLSVIENDPQGVKNYLENFVPLNYYRVLGDAYLYQVRAVLNHSVSHAELFNPKYDGLINDLTGIVGNNHTAVTQDIQTWSDAYQAGVIRTNAIEVRVGGTEASIVRVDKAIVTQHNALLEARDTMEVSIENIDIGGRNLIVNSDFMKGYATWYDTEISHLSHVIGDMHRVTNTGTASSKFGIAPLPSFKKLRLIEGKQYTLSFYAYGSFMLLNEIYITKPGGANMKLPDMVISSDLTDKRSMTFFAPITGDDLGFIIGATGQDRYAWFSLVGLKIEQGSMATDWTPAPEDIEKYIGEAYTLIDEFKQIQLTKDEAMTIKTDEMLTVIGDNSSRIDEESLTRTNQYRSLAEKTILLESTTGDNKASISSMMTTFTDYYSSQASKIGVLESGFGQTTGNISNIQKTVSDNEGTRAISEIKLNVKIDSVAMGGRNLVKNSNYSKGFKEWGSSIVVVEDNILGSLLTVSHDGGTTNYFGVENLDEYKNISLIADQEYILSFYASGTVNLTDIRLTNGSTGPIDLMDIPLTESLSLRSTIIFTATVTSPNYSLVIGAEGTSNTDWFKVVAVKLEQGNKATDWTPAIEDTQKIIEASITHTNNVAATITEGLNAKIGITTNVNNKISGWESTNNGIFSSFDILADSLKLSTNAGTFNPFIASGTELVVNVPLKANSTITTPSINGGSITGTAINIGSGKFTVTSAGVMTATTGTFSGNVSAATITGGTIDIGNGNFKVNSLGVLTASSGNFSGDITGASGNFSGDITGASGNFSGDITGASGNFSGDITGASGRFSGTVLANKIEGKVANIKDAAIKNAQIGLLAVEGANIKDLAVDTLQIAGNAVTIPRSLFAASEITAGSSWVTVHEATMDASDSESNGSIVVTIAFELIKSYASYDRTPEIYFRLLVNDVEVKLWTLPSNIRYEGQHWSGQTVTVRQASYSLLGVPHIETSSGGKTFKLQIKGQDDSYRVRATGTSLILMGSKR